VLSCLLLPDKGIAVAYTLFFGYYPILKSLLEKYLPRWLVWVCKFAAFNLAAIGIYYLVTEVFGLPFDTFGKALGKYTLLFMLAIGNATFFIYDLMVLSSFTMVYQRRWQKKMKHLMR